MSRRSIVTLCAALVLTAGIAVAQQPPVKPTEPVSNAPRPEAAGQPINVRVELTITDQVGAGEPLKKSVTILVVDRARASIRNMAGSRGTVNVDAQPQVSSSGSIRLFVGLEYTPSIPASATESTRTLSQLNEQITVMLESGKPLVISQSADPGSERKVTVQVTATVLK